MIGLEAAGRSWQIDLSSPLELAIPLDFQGPQARAFGLPAARAFAVEAGEFVGDRRRGGSANCETLHLTPHGNGTHTEGVGHITSERIPIADVAVPPLLPATLLTTPLRRLRESGENYDGRSRPDDQVICRSELVEARGHVDAEDSFLRALVIRIEDDNNPFDPLGDHSGTNPPYLTAEATTWLRAVGCDHLLVEIPSVDREEDGGSLSNHHRFFGLSPGRPAGDESRQRTITEMIRLVDSPKDGPYALSLRFPRLVTDAAPSRPVLYPLTERS